MSYISKYSNLKNRPMLDIVFMGLNVIFLQYVKTDLAPACLHNTLCCLVRIKISLWFKLYLIWYRYSTFMKHYRFCNKLPVSSVLNYKAKFEIIVLIS